MIPQHGTRDFDDRLRPRLPGGGSQFVVQQGSGRVGIGTNNPQTLFTIQTSGSGTTPLAVTNISGQPLLNLFSDGSQTAWLRLYDSKEH